MPLCRDCEGEAIWTSPFDGQELCGACARREIVSLLSELNQDETKILRRRAEDFLRKNPAGFMELAVRLVLKNQIKYIDLI